MTASRLCATGESSSESALTKHAEQVIDVHSGVMKPTTPALEWRWIVIHCSFVGITQGVIGYLNFLKSSCVATFVGMMLAGQSTESTFDFIGSSSSSNS
jgi:hypothetical protein